MFLNCFNDFSIKVFNIKTFKINKLFINSFNNFFIKVRIIKNKFLIVFYF